MEIDRVKYIKQEEEKALKQTKQYGNKSAGFARYSGGTALKQTKQYGNFEP